MKVLITGASSGIGKEFAEQFAKKGYDLFLVARRTEILKELKASLQTSVQIYSCDVSSEIEVLNLYKKIKEENIDIVISNAGFGLCGKFEETDLHRELAMIDVNIKGLHMLTKLFYQDFKKRDNGYILNIASSAAFLPGPLMATYYATKSYVLRLTEALYEELRVDKSKVYVGCLCPGPVETNFNKVAEVSFSVKPLQADKVVSYAIKKMFERKLIIIPGIMMKCTFIIEHFIPTKILMHFAYRFQKKKL